MDKLNELIDLLGTGQFTFSRWCIMGLVPKYAARCECGRCREARGEAPDEVLAEQVSRDATARFRSDQQQSLKGMRFQ